MHCVSLQNKDRLNDEEVGAFEIGSVVLYKLSILGLKVAMFTFGQSRIQENQATGRAERRLY